jgi:hypothetical protein
MLGMQALSRSMTLLHRAEAQRDAAQQRAAASQQRVLVLEKRMTEVSQVGRMLMYWSQ